MDLDRHILSGCRLIVVKIGTGVLSRPNGDLDTLRVRHLADQVAGLRRRKCQVVIVSSGAIGAGMARLGLRQRPTVISDLQACAAVGQNLLMARYEHAFTQRGITVAQILLTHEDLHNPTRRENASHTLHNLLLRGVVPVINENDAVSFAEINTQKGATAFSATKFGDNDQLAAMVTELIHAHACILLSTVDGFLMREGRKGRMRVTPSVKKISAEIERHAGDSDSDRSVGGMRSKLTAARRISSLGRPLVIANGRTRNILLRLIDGETVGTIFLP
jgi:glutamate 5-kinase